MTDQAFSAAARVPTAAGSRYLQQLSKHWAHKFPVNFTPEKSRIELPSGLCEMAAEEEALLVSIESASAEERDRLKDVVEKHIVRFAFREDLVFDWRNVTAA
ncbi:2,4-dihydroxyhept-2-ene-1,7-dioic acid aldolase [Zhengella mangrovi]|uniref:2,4-dihydroxyhept-2-ene-1,7-dioic acid aldolase n=1 Tax=Zhengella mangrovi TaxID=1982044 RepID=A0A2G1QKW3_9HYPH|nr:DUF2218 domain-containing protein [Zhengella mangrovi]PHP65848.1 2,4-dihydroxyhept-2-ene-1,7-dioic acid aldolase [Zhengella mangrovi]